MTITFEKHWDENERETEDSRGRVYVSTKGRWQWLAMVDGVAQGPYDLLREAKHAVGLGGVRCCPGCQAAAEAVKRLQPRVCAGCGRGKGTIAFALDDGGQMTSVFAHLKCFQKMRRQR